jgi:hypothetical protein
MASISGFGNGLGFVYKTNPDGVSGIASYVNSPENRDAVLHSASTDAPLSSETLAVGSVTVTAAGGTINTLTVNSVAIITGTVAGASTTLQASALASNINSTASSPRYTAIVFGNIVYIYAAVGTGLTPNGFVVAATVTGPTAVTTVNMDRGSPASGVNDRTYGHRWFINDSPSAAEGDLTGSVEITQYVVNRGLQTPVLSRVYEILGDTLAPDRVGNQMFVYVKTEGGAATDDLTTITTTAFNPGDRIVFSGRVVGEVTTFKTIVGGNIYLANAENFVTGDAQRTLVLQYQQPAGGQPTGWYEISRTPASTASVTVPSLRANRIAIEVQGADTQTLNAGGGTINLVPGTAKTWQQITGTATLAASWTIQGSGTPLPGDQFNIDYQAHITLNGSNITIGGIQLTTAEALNGGFQMSLYYDGSAWQATMADRAQTPLNYVAFNDTSTTAVTTPETLRTTNLAAGALATDGSVLKTIDTFTFAANGNTKTISKIFGATTLCTGSGAYNAVSGTIVTELIRTSATTQKAVCTILIDGEAVQVTTAAATETLTGAVTITTVGQNGSPSAADIVCNSTVHEVLIR